MGHRRIPRAAGTATLAAFATFAVLTAAAPAAHADDVDPATTGGRPASTTTTSDSRTSTSDSRTSTSDIRTTTSDSRTSTSDIRTTTSDSTTSTTDNTAAEGGAAVRAGSPLRIVIPLPRITVSRVCGARDDILSVDPAWLATWGDKVFFFPDSLTFQGGDDGELAKPAGMIKAEYRAQYRWAGSHGTEWASWLLYPGTVKPVVDRNVACPISVEAPQLARAVVCGPTNDVVSFADQASADHWRITARTWTGDVLTVSLRARRGYVGPGGALDLEQDYRDTGSCPSS